MSDPAFSFRDPVALAKSAWKYQQGRTLYIAFYRPASLAMCIHISVWGWGWDGMARYGMVCIDGTVSSLHFVYIG